jgi:hypothetical protein
VEERVRAFLHERRSALAAASVLLLLVASLGLLALAADVLQWESEVERGDAVFGAGAALDGAGWEPETILPAGASRALLAVGDDLEYRSAVRRFWLSRPRQPIREFEDVTRRTGAERQVARVGEADENPGRRARLSVLRGALLLEEARNSPVQRDVFVRRAIEQFTRAVTLDPDNQEALYNLELALRVLRSGGSGGEGGSTSRSPLPAPGAGSATSGGGF